MSEELKIWLGFWIKFVAIVFGFLTIGVVGCTITEAKEDAFIAEAIRSGKDPVGTRCTFDSDGKTQSAICTAYMMGRAAGK